MNKEEIGKELLDICINKWNRVMTPKQFDSIIDWHINKQIELLTKVFKAFQANCRACLEQRDNNNEIVLRFCNLDADQEATEGNCNFEKCPILREQRK